jgi:hypothetical protein
VDITHYLSQISVFIHHYGLVTPSEKRAVAAVFPVEPLCVESVHMSHDAREISLRGAQTEVIVVPHETVGKDFDSPPVVNFPNGFHKALVVLLVDKDLLPSASTVHDVIVGFGILDTKWSSHGKGLSRAGH